MKLKDKLTGWMQRYDRLDLRQRVLLAAAVAGLLVFVLGAVVVGPDEARSRALNSELAKQKAELDGITKAIRDTSALLENDPAAAQRQQLEEIKQRIAQADELLGQLEDETSKYADRFLREILGTSPGVELVSLRTLPPTLAYQTKPLPVAPPKPPVADASATPVPVVPPRPLRSVYRHGIEITIQGNYLAILPYLDKLQKFPGRLYWTDLSLSVPAYPISVVKVNVFTLGAQGRLPLG